MARAKSILVTGGAGYVGSFTVKEFLNQGYTVVVVDSLENGHKEAVDKRAKLEVVNIGDKEALGQVFKKYSSVEAGGQSSPDSPQGIGAVIDFAAYLAVGESMEEPVKYLKNNVANFAALLDTMAANGCKYIIKSSTASTYGNPKDKYFPLKEDYQSIYKPAESALLSGKWTRESEEAEEVEGEEFFQKIIKEYGRIFADRPELQLTDDEITALRIPASVYGLTKLMDEIIMKKYEDKNISSIALRYFNVSGAAADGLMGEDKPKPTTLMTLCFWNILGKIPELKVFGTDYPTKDGTGIRDYIHPLDLAAGHIAALEYLMKNNSTGRFNVFNLGTGQGYSVFEVIKAVEAASGKKVKYTIVDRRSGDPAVSYANPSKAGNILAWKAKYNLKDMAESAWKWHSTHPEGYEN